METLGLVALIIGLFLVLGLAIYESYREGFPLVRKDTFSILEFIWPTQKLQQVKRRLLTIKCPYCRNIFFDTDSVITCPACATKYHSECSREINKCTIFGCRGILVTKHENAEQLVRADQSSGPR